MHCIKLRKWDIWGVKTNEMVDRQSFHAKVLDVDFKTIPKDAIWYIFRWPAPDEVFGLGRSWPGRVFPCFTVTSTVRPIVEPPRWVSWYSLPARWPQCYGFDGRQWLLYVDTQDGSNWFGNASRGKFFFQALPNLGKVKPGARLFFINRPK